MGLQGHFCADGNAVPEADDGIVCQRGKSGMEPVYRAWPGWNSVDVRAHADCGVIQTHSEHSKRGSQLRERAARMASAARRSSSVSTPMVSAGAGAT